MYNSVERLNYSITKLLKLFETAKVEHDKNHAAKILLRIKDLGSQNEKIAKGILSLANIVKDNLASQETPDYQDVLSRLDRLEMLLKTNTPVTATEDYQKIIAKLDALSILLQSRPEPQEPAPEEQPEPMERIPLKPKKPKPMPHQELVQEPRIDTGPPPTQTLQSGPGLVLPNKRMDTSTPIGLRQKLPQFQEPIEPSPMTKEDLGGFEFIEESKAKRKAPQETPELPIEEGFEDLEIPKPPEEQRSFLNKLKK